LLTELTETALLPRGTLALKGSVEVPQRGVADALLGRGRELRLIAAFLDRARSSGEALLVTGEAGAGKTALLDAAGEMASAAGTRILRAGGVEFEAGLSFSALNQALLPLRGEFAGLCPAHRDALNVSLGFGAGPAPGRLTVCSATLELLRRAAIARGVLVVVDDLPWLDRASAAVLGFVARRLTGSGVGFLAASRSGQEGFFERAGLPERELGPLDGKSASVLVSSRFPALAPGVRQRLLAEARGNPLALLELPAALSGPQRAAVEALPALLPLGQRLQSLFASRVRDLPARTRQLLLMAALDCTGDLRVLDAAGPGGLEDLAAAEQAGLVSVGGSPSRLAFRHPLTRSAVVELATESERRRAHRVLAGLWPDQPGQRAWHLAEAAAGPDEDVAALLEQTAHRVLARGDAVGALAALTRAAGLSPRGADRGRRLAEAAYIGTEATGELGHASILLADARRSDPALSGSLHAAAATAYLLLNGDGDIATAHRLLTGAIETGDHGYGARDSGLIEALHTLMLVCRYGGRPELWEPFHQALARLKPGPPAVLSVTARTLADPARTAAAARNELRALATALHDQHDPAQIIRIGTAAVNIDGLGDVREGTWRLVLEGRAGGPARRHLVALIHLCLDDFLTGQWEEGRQLADEGLAVCEDHGYRFSAWNFLYTQAILAAARGEDEASRALADRITQWAVPRGAHGTELRAHHPRVLSAIGQGDFEDAYRRAAVLSPAGTLASHAPYALWVAFDLVEAAVRTGRQAEANAHVTAMTDADIAAISPRMALLQNGAAAVAAPDNSAPGLFERALSIPGASHWPFDLARVQLAYGERLRRGRAATAEARVHLTAALETFERLGARPWAGRAASELRASGQTGPRVHEQAGDTLTPQEHEIAMLAAAGLSNKQIGQRLYLSHKTVGNHLFRIFPKLGVTSRAALRDVRPREVIDSRHTPDVLAVDHEVAGGGQQGR
jgi:DNA-binding CsgD family transcriptional regulator